MPTYKTGIGTNAEADEREDHYELHEKLQLTCGPFHHFFDVFFLIVCSSLAGGVALVSSSHLLCFLGTVSCQKLCL